MGRDMTCIHHWLLEKGGRHPRGVCELCGETKQFTNDPPERYNSTPKRPSPNVMLDPLPSREMRRLGGRAYDEGG